MYLLGLNKTLLTRQRARPQVEPTAPHQGRLQRPTDPSRIPNRDRVSFSQPQRAADSPRPERTRRRPIPVLFGRYTAYPVSTWAKHGNGQTAGPDGIAHCLVKRRRRCRTERREREASLLARREMHPLSERKMANPQVEEIWMRSRKRKGKELIGSQATQGQANPAGTPGAVENGTITDRAP